ncbi:MAG TPA: DNA alkylation repair protein [bacterium]|nr:DNA alkylation repair protein [bacterium]HPL95427.1 DNA alkylation repair protein [bacterium]
MTTILNYITSDLKKLAKPKKALVLQRFFKTGKGQYGEGDIFLGIIVPEQRKLVKKYFKQANLDDIQKLLKSKIHEYRLVALLTLVEKFKSTFCHPHESEDPQIQRDPRFHGDDRKEIYDFYLKNTRYINNWDLVDLSAPNIIGEYLARNYADNNPSAELRGKKILYKLVYSKNLWERRIAILATATFIRNNQFNDTIKIAKILLRDKHDLIHKATGWMLREMGKRDQKQLLKFLDLHKKEMPRTMLRYAIEKLPEVKRKHYLNK